MTLKYLREFGDLHLDFDIKATRGWEPFKDPLPCWVPTELPTDKETALIIAGDLWTSRKYLAFCGEHFWLATVAKRFYCVIFVLGNHDLWDSNISNEYNNVRNDLAKSGLTNVYLIQDSQIVIDNVKFLGGTLWTDMNKQDPLTRLSWQNAMANDRKYITIGNAYHKIKESDVLAAHFKTRSYIFDNATRDNSNQKIVVISHHAPTNLSIDDRYADDTLRAGYYHSDIGNEIAYSEIDLWFHGHTHNSVNYLVHQCRVVNNPRGYHYDDMLNKQFDETHLFNIEDL